MSILSITEEIPMRTDTINQATVRMLLNGDTRGVQRLYKQVRAMHENRIECPDCYHSGPHDDNGMSASHYDFALCCASCGCHWNPND